MIKPHAIFFHTLQALVYMNRECNRFLSIPLHFAPQTSQVNTTLSSPFALSSKLPQLSQKTRDPIAAIVEVVGGCWCSCESRVQHFFFLILQRRDPKLRPLSTWPATVEHRYRANSEPTTTTTNCRSSRFSFYRGSASVTANCHSFDIQM